jgi:hypothetical protein
MRSTYHLLKAEMCKVIDSTSTPARPRAEEEGLHVDG